MKKIETLDFTTDELDRIRGRLGLIVLQNDQTIEDEFRSLLQEVEGVSLLHARIPSGGEVTSDMLKLMEQDIVSSASLYPEGVDLDVVGYACTSGSAVLGEYRVRELIREACGQVAVTNPLTALKEALTCLGIKRLGFIAPYSEEIVEFLCQEIEQAMSGSVKITQVKTFGQSKEEIVARIDESSVRDAVLGCRDEVDGVFISCTNLRTLRIIQEVEDKLRKPVFSSNSVLCWHMLRLTGINHNITPTPRSTVTKDLI